MAMQMTIVSMKPRPDTVITVLTSISYSILVLLCHKHDIMMETEIFCGGEKDGETSLHGGCI